MWDDLSPETSVLIEFDLYRLLTKDQHFSLHFTSHSVTLGSFLLGFQKNVVEYFAIKSSCAGVI